MFDQIARRKEREERQENPVLGVFLSFLRKRFWTLVLAALLVGSILWRKESILAYAQNATEELVLSEDGYYEIGTARDYLNFWKIVEESDAFAKGRLMKDICLNDLSDYGNWKEKAPINHCVSVKKFYGTFDGNGHIVSGIYSDKGYGLVEHNRGQIMNLIIEDSLILNVGCEALGGICGENDQLVRNCQFTGEIYSGKNEQFSKAGGICGGNTGTVEQCGFTGKLNIKGWSSDNAAGICGKNEGEIRNSYNFADMTDTPLLVNRFYAITDQGDAGCFVLKDTGWRFSENENTLTVNRGQREWLSVLIQKNAYAFLTEGNEKIGAVFDREEISMFLWGAILAEGEQWEGLCLKTEASPDMTLLQLTDAKETVVIKIRQMPDAWGKWDLVESGAEKWDEFTELWKQCDAILTESGVEDYERYSWNMTGWRMMTGWRVTSIWQKNKETYGKFILYQTEEGKTGFFWYRKGLLYQVESTVEESPDIQDIKRQISSISRQKETEQRGTVTMYEAMLWTLWDRHMPACVGWQSTAMRDSLCGLRVPAWEEIEKTEELHVSNMGTFEDLKKMPHVKRLYIRIDWWSEIQFDLTRELAPELEELNIEGGTFKDVDFLEQLPQLRKLNMTNCGVEDISGIRYQKELLELSFCRNQIEDIRILENLSELERLNLSGNQIKDFEPITGLTGLVKLNIRGNPGQNIGDLIFLPKLEIGSCFSTDEKLQKEAQEILNQYYPEQEITADDMVKGDLNGDGITDLAIAGLTASEESSYLEKRELYVFLGQSDSKLRPLKPFETAGTDGRCTDEEIMIADGRLVIKTEGYGVQIHIYQYEKEERREEWEQRIYGLTSGPGLDIFIYDWKKGLEYYYAEAYDEGGESRWLLLAEGNDPSGKMEEYREKYTEFEKEMGVSLPTVEQDGLYFPQPAIEQYPTGYLIHDTLLDTGKRSVDVLREAAEKYLYEYRELPVPLYTSEEIFQNYQALAGVELPEISFIGKDKKDSEEIKILVYEGCRQYEDGSFEHKLSLWRIWYMDEKPATWTIERNMYYDEKDGVFSVG